MKLEVLVPEIESCAASDCSYNAGGDCHARAITVGDHAHPQCDTHAVLGRHSGNRERAGVGACKVTSCRHNRDLECEAEAIRVVTHGDHADCDTFVAR